MTLQRRLLRLMLIGAPVAWLLAAGLAALSARHEIDEMFDAQQVRLAQQVLSLLPAGNPQDVAASASSASPGVQQLEDLAITVWSADGVLRFSDQAGANLPPPPDRDGFADVRAGSAQWRMYYLIGAPGARNAGWRVAVGQRLKGRRELTLGLLLAQAGSWLGLLALLGVLMTLALRHALQPMRSLADSVRARSADDLRPLPPAGVTDLQPLVDSTNQLLARVKAALEHERRLTADAAHELRTPLAALRAQVDAADAARRAGDAATEDHAREQLRVGTERLSHLVDQLLTLARAESGQMHRHEPVDWSRVVADALSPCLPLADARGSEIEVLWPVGGAATALPVTGDPPLLATLLRNLIDNALRYAPPRSQLRVRFTEDSLAVEDNGPGVSPEALARLGDRFYRPAGQSASGSGLGVSIVRRIAELHGLTVRASNRPAGEGAGLRVELRRA